MAATIDTMCRELLAARAGALFDVFIISDTQDPVERKWSARARICACAPSTQRACKSMRVGGRQIRRKKAGNIRDWIEDLARHIRISSFSTPTASCPPTPCCASPERWTPNPRAGLIQTVPRLAGGESLFARLQQFAACYYGQILAAGLAAWHGHGGNYWGHNAIIRTAAFASSAGLPQLPGKPPLGGHILSHDFVEAALLRRAGWEVHMVPSLEGSYEGCPPTLSRPDYPRSPMGTG